MLYARNRTDLTQALYNSPISLGAQRSLLAEMRKVEEAAGERTVWLEAVKRFRDHLAEVLVKNS